MNDEGGAASQPVGVVGLGLVGRALAERLAAAGFVPCGFDIDPARRAAAEARGLACAETLGDLARRCTIALIVVYDGTQAASVCTEMGKAAPRQLDMLISITTCLPGEIEALSRAAAEHNLDFIEMPISGTSAEIAAGTATGLVAGSAAALARAEAILAALCPRRIPVGGLGQASRMKLAINLVLQLNRAALALPLPKRSALSHRPFSTRRKARRRPPPSWRPRDARWWNEILRRNRVWPRP
jgi:3-hydroxyisobutyrate dehydrogenase-like beta-hydroxyacid dehydrogenase